MLFTSMDVRFFLDNLWRWKCGLPENELRAAPPLEDLRASEWDPTFERLMRNRLVMGAIRYGRMGEGGKPRYDRVGSMIKRILEFRKSGNKELLVDVANLCMLEFVEGDHPAAHFYAKAEGEHVETKTETC